MAGSRNNKPVPTMHGRLWIELNGGIALSDAAADLLEQIEASGSLSEAARRLRFSYRRAWVLIDNANRRWSQPLVVLSTGGKKGGGAQLTETGQSVLRAYRDLQIQFEHFLESAAAPLQRSIS